MKRLKRQHLRKLEHWKVTKSTLLKNSNRRELECQSARMLKKQRKTKNRNRETRKLEYR
ncbi:hypothetical protein K0M31_001065 [Melipona bicolor]|uniref:Uncharacterized protein n=1 Tax=Melipona bicolor TaxID=60889 RepID=A0AA40GF00_9HYME|nr:hypothetical protein K0M31_001065 [Melipona bicolor]